MAQDEIDRTDGDRFARADQHIEPLDLVGFGARACHFGPIGGDEPGYALDMVDVMMGDENVAQSPAARAQRRFDGLGVRRIDRSGLAGHRIVDEVAVVVLAAHEDVDDQAHGYQSFRDGFWFGHSGRPQSIPFLSFMLKRPMRRR